MKVEEFKQAIDAEGGLAHSNRFSVELPLSVSGTPFANGSGSVGLYFTQDISLLCEAANIPGSQVGTTERTLGAETIKVGNARIYPEVTLTFMLTNSYDIKRFFDEWQDCVVSREPPYHIGYYENYAEKHQLTINQLDKNDKKVFSCKLIEVFPTSVTDVSFNAAGQNTYSTFSVSLSYKRWIEG